MTAADPLAALERIKAEAQRLWLNPPKKLWREDRIATAEFLGEVLKRHAEAGWLTSLHDAHFYACIQCSWTQYPCPDAAAALALIAQLDGGTT
jgi:hypothetical protein